MKKYNPIKLHFTLFLILSAAALAQLSWWVIFQVQEGSRLTAQQKTIWNQQIDMARTYFNFVNPYDSEKTPWLEANFPDLQIDSLSGDYVVSPEANQRLDRLAQKRVRMFVSEGAFFSLLVLTGVWFLFWALRKRIELENKTAAILSAASSGMKIPLSAIRNDIETVLKSSQTESAMKEVIERISSNIRKIAETCESVTLIQMLGASKRKIELEMTDISDFTESVISDYLTAHSGEKSRVEYNVADGLTAVTNTRQWSRVVQGIVQIVDNVAPSKYIINIDFFKEADCGILKVVWQQDSGDNDIDNIRRELDNESGIIRELGETIGVRVEVFVENGNSVGFSARMPLLEE